MPSDKVGAECVDGLYARRRQLCELAAQAVGALFSFGYALGKGGGDARAHLRRRRSRERDDEKTAYVVFFVLPAETADDPLGQDAGLSRACRGGHDYKGIFRGYRFFLGVGKLHIIPPPLP